MKIARESSLEKLAEEKIHQNILIPFYAIKDIYPERQIQIQTVTPFGIMEISQIRHTSDGLIMFIGRD